MDGKTRTEVGAMFGRPMIVHSARINGWPVISMYWHLSSTSGTFSTFVHGGQRYQQVSSARLYDKAVTVLFKRRGGVVR
jgi:hypothetical protein